MDSRGNADAAGARRRAVRWPVLCWVAVLLLTGIVQVVRVQWFDAAVFGAAAVVVMASPRIPSGGAFRAPLRAVTAGAVTAGLVLCLLPRHSAPMVVVVIAIGAAAVAFAWGGTSTPPRPWSRSLRRLGWAWTGLVVAGCLWESPSSSSASSIPGHRRMRSAI